MLSDHSIQLYTQHIVAAAIKEHDDVSRGEESHDEEDLVIRNAGDGEA